MVSGFQLLRGTAIGHRHIKQIVPIKTRRLKLKVSESVGTPLIQEFSCYNSEKNSVMIP